ncbi:MAG TPA: DUF4234 domain-containing protein [Ruminiclostridium sp.]
MVKGTTRSPALVIVLSIITCGIYFLYWIYKSSEEMKFYLNTTNSPATELILCILCFPYQYYWFYKQGKNLAEASKIAGLVGEDNSILYLILAILGLGIVNSAIMQANANNIWGNQQQF